MLLLFLRHQKIERRSTVPLRKAISENPLSIQKNNISFLSCSAGAGTICITDPYYMHYISFHVCFFRFFLFLISIFICTRKRSWCSVPKGLSHSERKLFWHRFFNIQIQDIYLSSHAYNFYLVCIESAAFSLAISCVQRYVSVVCLRLRLGRAYEKHAYIHLPPGEPNAIAANMLKNNNNNQKEIGHWPEAAKFAFKRRNVA